MKIYTSYIAFLKKITNSRLARPIKKMSFKYKLICSFIFASITPILLVQSISYYNMTTSMKENVDELINFNLVQTEKNLNTALNSYTDILYQIYTDDEIVDLVNKMNEQSENALEVNILREKLRKLTNAKEGIRSIAILCSSGKSVFYDLLTASSIESFWIGNKNFDRELFYSKAAGTNRAVLLPTAFAAQQGDRKYYLFHIANKLVDFKNIKKEAIGVVVISIDEDIVYRACNETKSNAPENKNVKSVNFVVDQSGNIVSFPDKAYVGTRLADQNGGQEGRAPNKYAGLLQDANIFSGKSVIINELSDDNTGWNIVNAVDQSYLFSRMYSLQRLTVFFGALAILFSAVIIIYITRNFSGSIGKILTAMKTAQGGELSVQVELDDSDDDEISVLGTRFNKMITRINQLVEEVKDATYKQKEAEIRALEAQINPHFLYNTLDSINWMAIDKEEHEISNMLKSLAQILRYSVNKSNKIVKLRDEMEWLKQYLYLQQTRFNYSFECSMNVDDGVMDCRVHKLLFQPFIENAIVHGFEGHKKGGILKIDVRDRGDYIHITIEDNGKGMKKEVADILNSSEERQLETNGSGLGVKNVFGRIGMYYGDHSKWKVESIPGQGTAVFLQIPKL